MNLTEVDNKACVHIEYHADDYGLFPTQSRRILDCHVNGKLNGVSIMPNSPELDECIELLRPYEKEIACTIHLNLIEGRSVCNPAEVPLLVDKNGLLSGGFARLLLCSLLPGRKSYKEQIKREFKAQIQLVRPKLSEDTPLRLDGHAHYHMLPVAFDALMELITEEKLNVSYIRIPREYSSIYFRHWRSLSDISPINFIKVLVLNALSRRNIRKYGSYLNTLEKKLFMGVFLSGRMYRENVAPLLTDAVRLAEKSCCGIEILAHPGGVFEREDAEKLTCTEDIAFLTRKARIRERSLFVHEE